eukprot:5324197-Pleurochrysis_carterae.AAC.2
MGRLWVGLLAGGGGHAQVGNPKPGERSASAPQVRMQCERNLGNCACECQTATKGDSFRYRTARKSTQVIDRSRGQNGRESASMAISLGYRYIVHCVKGNYARNGSGVQISSDNPQVGHWQAFAAIYADEGICDSYVVRGAGCHECEDHGIYGAPRHIRL